MGKHSEDKGRRRHVPRSRWARLAVDVISALSLITIFTVLLNAGYDILGLVLAMLGTFLIVATRTNRP